MNNSEHTKYLYLKSNYNIDCEPFTNIENKIRIKIFNGELYTSINYLLKKSLKMNIVSYLKFLTS